MQLFPSSMHPAQLACEVGRIRIGQLASLNTIDLLSHIAHRHGDNRHLAGQGFAYNGRGTLVMGGEQEHIAGINPDGNFRMIHSRKAVKFCANTLRSQMFDCGAGEPGAFDRVPVVRRKKNMEAIRIPAQFLPAGTAIQRFETVQVDAGGDDLDLPG